MARINYRELGFGQKAVGKIDRLINKDGSFNVVRSKSNWHGFHPYQYLITTTWAKFLLITLLFYGIINMFFALIYAGIGVEHFNGIEKLDSISNFSQLFYFSAQTFTTVGYGAISPKGSLANLVASLEAMAGLMTFALATGLVYGRFAKPNTKIIFSENALIAPYQEGKSLQFRIINSRKSELIELETQVTLAWLEEDEKGNKNRRFYQLELEVSKINFFPLNWTLVHDINEKSPLYGKTAEDMKNADMEILIIIKAYDDIYFQVVYTRSSYRYYEVVWDAKFTQMFHVSPSGQIVSEIEKVGAYQNLAK
jgi:inward rectifier potassium channel